ncbi:MAG TPA: hypothetical protein EYP07_12930 [Kiloniellaceae bacterium]|nr:hypothetical protein [Kiloniellaceae bacterium]
MVEQYLQQDQVMLCGIEAAKGTEEALTPAANAIKVGGPPAWRPGFDIDNAEDEVTGSLDPGDPTVLAGNASMTFTVRAKGSGAAGTAPEGGVLHRATGFAESVLGASENGTAQAGAANTITLAVAASAVDDFYKGMPIFLTAGPGSGEDNVITAYDGTTKVATVARPWTVQPTLATDYDIPANVIYRPGSADLETVTAFLYQNANEAAVNSVLRKLVGAMGNATFDIGPRQIPQWSYTLTGLFPESPSDVARPAGVVYDAVNAPPFVNADAWLGGVPFRLNTLSFDLGNTIAQPDDPAATFGRDVASITRRLTTGSFTSYRRLIANRNPIADLIAGTKQTLVLKWGQVAGNRISVLFPAITYTGADEQGVEGYSGEQIPFRATGADDGLWLCYH